MSTPQGIFAVDIPTYVERVREAKRRMEYLGTGSQRNCAAFIDEQQIAVSQVIRGVLVDEYKLYKIEVWIYNQYNPHNQMRIEPRPIAA